MKVLTRKEAQNRVPARSEPLVLETIENIFELQEVLETACTEVDFAKVEMLPCDMYVNGTSK